MKTLHLTSNSIYENMQVDIIGNETYFEKIGDQILQVRLSNGFALVYKKQYGNQEYKKLYIVDCDFENIQEIFLLSEQNDNYLLDVIALYQ